MQSYQLASINLLLFDLQLSFDYCNSLLTGGDAEPVAGTAAETTRRTLEGDAATDRSMFYSSVD